MISLTRLKEAHEDTAVHVLSILEVDLIVAELIKWRSGCINCITLKRERDDFQAMLTLSQLSRSPYLGKDHSGVI